MRRAFHPEEKKRYREEVFLAGKPDTSMPEFQALFSASRNQAALRLHATMRLFVAFHLPAVFSHLETVEDSWWYPRGFAIESQPDFVAVGTWREFHRQSGGSEDPQDLPLGVEGMIPTCWLLGSFIEPELFGDSAVWRVEVSGALLDQLVIRGNPAFSLFFLLALLRRGESAILAGRTAGEVEGVVRSLPWSEAIPAVLAEAGEMEAKTPVSARVALRSVFAQCASEWVCEEDGEEVKETAEGVMGTAEGVMGTMEGVMGTMKGVMGTVKDTVKDTMKDTMKDTVKDTMKDTMKDTVKDTLMDFSREAKDKDRKDTSTDIPMNPSKDTSKDTTKNPSINSTLRNSFSPSPSLSPTQRLSRLSHLFHLPPDHPLRDPAGIARATPSLELTALQTLAIPHALSRDIPFPPFPSFATAPDIPAIPAIPLLPDETLPSLLHDSRGTFFLDLRDAPEKEGILGTGVMAQGRLWATPLLVEGVSRCLQQLRGNVPPPRE